MEDRKAMEKLNETGKWFFENNSRQRVLILDTHKRNDP